MNEGAAPQQEEKGAKRVKNTIHERSPGEKWSTAGAVVEKAEAGCREAGMQHMVGGRSVQTPVCLMSSLQEEEGYMSGGVTEGAGGNRQASARRYVWE